MTSLATGTASAERPTRDLRAGRSGGHPRWRRLRGGSGALLFALPAIVIFGLFAWYPITRATVMSFQRTNFVQDATWVGWGNFSYVLGDPLFGTAMLNTFYFTGLAILIGFPLPILLAVLISEVRRRKGIYTVLAYLPGVVPPVVAILLWRNLYRPDESGVLNALLNVVGIPPLSWLSSVQLAMPSIVAESIWASVGTNVIIYVAALTQVPRELYEAAELDGASILKRAWHVTIPQLRSVMLVILLLQIIGGMQVFAEPFIFTGGGPQNATVSILLLIYKYAFVNGDYGAAAAASVILAVILAVIAGIYALITRKLGNA